MYQEDDKYSDASSETEDLDETENVAASPENDTDEQQMMEDAKVSEEAKNTQAIAAAEDICASGMSGSIASKDWMEIQKEASETILAADGMQLLDSTGYTDISENSTAYQQRQTVIDSAILTSGLRAYSIKTRDDIIVADVELFGVKSDAVSVMGLYRVVLRTRQTSSSADNDAVNNASSEVGSSYKTEASKYVLVGAKKLSSDIAIASASATSTLVDSADTSKYAAQNICDHSMKTAWVEGVDGLGEGESVTLKLSEEASVHGIRIAPGYDKNNATISENAAPVKIRLEFSDGTSMTADLSYGDYSEDLLCATGTQCIINHAQTSLMGLDSSEWETAEALMDIVSFGKEIRTSWIKVTILEVKAGTDWPDTCISEISVY